MSEKKNSMTVDERLQFLLESTESLHSSCQELHATAQAMQESMQVVQESMKKHDQRWEKFRRVVRAALEAGFADDGENDENHEG
jgi:hypothetical protein